MKFLLLLWTIVRNTFEAAVWATAVWTCLDSFYDIEWIYLFWVFFAILFLTGGKVIGAEPSLVPAFLIIDLGLVGLAILQGLMTSLIPTIVAIFLFNMISRWTHKEPDWVHVFLFFACAFYILWRRNGKHKAIQGWKGTPRPTPKTSGSFKTASPTEHLPEWQRDTLAEHRQQRALQTVEPEQILWTRPSKGGLVTELELYWAHVVPWVGDEIGLIVYSKDSGAIAESWYDFKTEQQAMDSAVEFMRYGKVPKSDE